MSEDRVEKAKRAYHDALVDYLIECLKKKGIHLDDRDADKVLELVMWITP